VRICPRRDGHSALSDAIGKAPQSLDARVSNLTCAGRMRVGTFPPQCGREPVSGELRGWSVDLVHALSARLGIAAATIEYPGPNLLIGGLMAGECDAGFLPNSPDWSTAVDFSDPFLQMDFTFLAAAGCLIRRAGAADRPGVRIAVVRYHASTLALMPKLRHATPVEVNTLDNAVDLLRRKDADLFASTRPQLIQDSTRLPGSTVLKGRYGFIFMTVAVRKGEFALLTYLNGFLRAAKAAGLVQRAVEKAGWRGVKIV